MMELTISGAKEICQRVIEATAKKVEKGLPVRHAPLYLHSSPGIGKSAVTKQIAESLDLKLRQTVADKKGTSVDEVPQQFGFVDLRLASMEASDVCGIPYVSHAGEDGESMEFSIPGWFPTQEKVNSGAVPAQGIIFFDELSNAPIGVQHAAYRLILDREVQTGVKLPDGWQIVAAGNKKDDKTGAKAVAPALANRFGTHMFIRHNLDDFIAYAVDKGLNKEVIGFLAHKPDDLYRFDPKKNDVAFATPRSWEAASNLLDMGFGDDELPYVLSGCIGEATSNDFMEFRKYYEKLPNFADIMDGKMEYEVPKNDLGMLFAVASNLIVLLRENADNKKRVKNLEKVLTQMNDDFLVLVYKSIGSSMEKGDEEGGRDLTAIRIISQTAKTFRRINKYM